MVSSIVIVGAGECGTRVALGLRENGYSGSVTLVGAERYDPYERPPLSKAMLHHKVAEPTPPIASASDLADKNIDFIRGVPAYHLNAEFRSLTLDDGRVLHYDRMLFATGSRARELSIPGCQHAHYLREFDDLPPILEQLGSSSRICILGGGLIGLEIAASAAQSGHQVVVIEYLSRLLSRVAPAGIGDVIRERHEAAGVEFRFDESVVSIADEPSGYAVRLQGGKSLATDVVIAGIGAVPNSELAETAGIQVDNGIRVDARLRTSDPFVYAAGDCCAFPHALYGNDFLRLESWRNAQDQASIAAENLMGGSQEYRAVPWFWSDQYELSLQIAGLPGRAPITVTRERDDGVQLAFFLHEDHRLLGAAAVSVGNTVAKDIRIAEKIIERGLPVNPALLTDASVPLKTLLRRPATNDEQDTVRVTS